MQFSWYLILALFFIFFSNFISSIAMFFIERNNKSYTTKVQKVTGNTTAKTTRTRTQDSPKSTIDDEHIQQGLKLYLFYVCYDYDN